MSFSLHRANLLNQILPQEIGVIATNITFEFNDFENIGLGKRLTILSNRSDLKTKNHKKIFNFHSNYLILLNFVASHTFYQKFQYFYTDISAISVTFCNSVPLPYCWSVVFVYFYIQHPATSFQDIPFTEISFSHHQSTFQLSPKVHILAPPSPQVFSRQSQIPFQFNTISFFCNPLRTLVQEFHKSDHF